MPAVIQANVPTQHKQTIKMNKRVIQPLKSSPSILFRNCFLQSLSFNVSATSTLQRFYQHKKLVATKLTKKAKTPVVVQTPSQSTSAIGTTEAPSLRDHKDYAWLLSLETIKSNIGKFVKLPVLPLGIAPKNFSDCIVNNFLLTEQRAALLERIINEINEPFPLMSEKGMSVKGTTGVGKSVFSYLVAAYAWVNRLPLVYIVCCLFSGV